MVRDLTLEVVTRIALPLSLFVALSSLSATASADARCRLQSARGEIRHVIYVAFDNTHLRRDNPNVPSDLEQMPHLLSFLQHDGALLSRHHTPLISHTATDLLTALTGLYGDRHGIPVADAAFGHRAVDRQELAHLTEGARALVEESIAIADFVELLP